MTHAEGRGNVFALRALWALLGAFGPNGSQKQNICKI